MVSISLIPVEFSLIDCSSVIAFSGADFGKPRQFITYRQKIWDFLESQINTERLKTVPQFWEELAFNDESSYRRLHPFRERFTVHPDEDTDHRIRLLLFTYPSLLAGKARTYTREPSDPFLIVFAQKWHTPIVADEKRLSERTGKNQSKSLSIADVCDCEKIECVNIERYLKSNGVIPPDYTP